MGATATASSAGYPTLGTAETDAQKEAKIRGRLPSGGGRSGNLVRDVLVKEVKKVTDKAEAEASRIAAFDLQMRSQKSQSYGLQRSKRSAATAASALLLTEPQQPPQASKTLLGY